MRKEGEKGRKKNETVACGAAGGGGIDGGGAVGMAEGWPGPPTKRDGLKVEEFLGGRAERPAVAVHAPWPLAFRAPLDAAPCALRRALARPSRAPQPRRFDTLLSSTPPPPSGPAPSPAGGPDPWIQGLLPYAAKRVLRGRVQGRGGRRQRDTHRGEAARARASRCCLFARAFPAPRGLRLRHAQLSPAARGAPALTQAS